MRFLRRNENDLHSEISQYNFANVYSLFKETIENTQGSIFYPRNGTTVLKPDTPHPTMSKQSSPDIYRESSFTKEQDKILDTCIKILAKELFSEKSGIPQLPLRVESCAEAYLKIFTSIFENNTYSALIPAFYALLVGSKAGAQGLELAFHVGVHEKYRDKNFDGTEIKNNLMKFIGYFGNNHELPNLDYEQKLEIERMCRAPQLALDIIESVDRRHKPMKKGDRHQIYLNSIKNIEHSIEISLYYRLRELSGSPEAPNIIKFE